MCAALETEMPIGALRGTPHSPQNFAVGALSAPHCAQRGLSAIPHSEQNFLLSGFSNPQFEQCIELLRNCPTATHLYHPASYSAVVPKANTRIIGGGEFSFDSNSKRPFIVRLLGVLRRSRHSGVRPSHKSSRRRTSVDL